MSGKRTVAILGSTGTIGINAIKVIEDFSDEFEIVLLSAGTNLDLLLKQCQKTNPKYAILDQQLDAQSDVQPFGHTKLLTGKSAYQEVIEAGIEIDVLVLAISGFAGVKPCMQLLPCSKVLAIANKETIICLGNILLDEAQRHHVTIAPVDSEHNSLTQLLNKVNREDVDSIVITASGGPFWNYEGSFDKITPQMALKHPTWKMGIKNSIDSATLFNKGLELIEAAILFNMKEQDIKIVIHPQSIIHAMINMKDAGTFALLSKPDMKFHIANAMRGGLHDRTCTERLDLVATKRLEFHDVDHQLFPAINLARHAVNTGHSHVIAYNAANEIMVKYFCEQKITFPKIAEYIGQVLDRTKLANCSSLAEVIEQDRIARHLAVSVMQ